MWQEFWANPWLTAIALIIYLAGVPILTFLMLKKLGSKKMETTQVLVSVLLEWILGWTLCCCWIYLGTRHDISNEKGLKLWVVAWLIPFAIAIIILAVGNVVGPVVTTAFQALSGA